MSVTGSSLGWWGGAGWCEWSAGLGCEGGRDMAQQSRGQKPFQTLGSKVRRKETEHACHERWEVEGSGREGVSWVREQPPGGASAILGVAGVCLVACVPSGVVRALCRLGGSCSWAKQAALGAGVPASAPLDAFHSALTWVPLPPC